MDTTTPIGLETIDAIIKAGEEAYDYVHDSFPPETEYYRIDDSGDGVYPEDWRKVWGKHPAWWEHAWLLLDNIEYLDPDAPRIDDSRKGLAAMSVDEIERIFGSCDYCGMYAYYTDSGEDGIGWWEED